MDLQGLLANPQNRWVLVCFVLFLALPVLFAVLYRRLYQQDEGNFFFPRDAVFASRLHTQLDRLTQDIAHIDKVIDAVNALISHVKRNPDQCRGSAGVTKIELPDGRCCVFEPHEDVNPTRTDVYVSTRLTVLDGAGRELVSIWLARDGFGLPREAAGFCDALAAYTAEWRQHRGQMEQQLGLVESGRALWSFEDFLYFSALTQTTLGCNDIVPNSTKVRRLVMLQLLLAYAVLVILVNVVIFPNR
jgi:hypothetical protein